MRVKGGFGREIGEMILGMSGLVRANVRRSACLKLALFWALGSRPESLFRLTLKGLKMTFGKGGERLTRLNCSQAKMNFRYKIPHSNFWVFLKFEFQYLNLQIFLMRSYKIRQL